MTPREQIEWFIGAGGPDDMAVRVIRAALGIIDRAHPRTIDQYEGCPPHDHCGKCGLPWKCEGATVDEAALWKVIGGQE